LPPFRNRFLSWAAIILVLCVLVVSIVFNILLGLNKSRIVNAANTLISDQLDVGYMAYVFPNIVVIKDAVLVPVTALQSLPAGRQLPGNSDGAGARNPGTPPKSGGLMQAQAAEGPRGMPDEGRMAAFRQAREANPDAEMGTVLVMEANGEPRPQPVLVGLKTRTQAQILFGLEPGQKVVTGEVKLEKATSAQMQPPPGGMPPPR